MCVFGLRGAGRAWRVDCTGMNRGVQWRYMLNINLTLPEELLEAIDEARGDVPRTVWIQDALLSSDSP